MDHKFYGKYIIGGKIHCLTGLHIGGSTEGIEIGGIDNPVIKDPLTEYPYIPGSSVKGKLRSFSEWSMGLIKREGRRGYIAYLCEELADPRPEENFERWDNALLLGKVYGTASDNPKVAATAGPTRLTIRDAFPEENTIEKWKEMLGEDTSTEIKWENTIDRVTSEANPRPMERVPAGSEFKFEMIFDIYDPDEGDLLKELLSAMHLLEYSSLGGSGSRGHGQITFQDISIHWRPVQYYKTGQGDINVDLPGNDVKNLLENFDSIQWPQIE